ncbi:MAG: UvrD-helicase domain-containing protein [Deltaproteobacteria bacterium]|nr:UvrD-helicase domain-containing protein [Deltaproteobacteria bacterium]
MLEDQKARDAAVRERVGVTWIEAGAGTGKTRTMVLRILRLVMEEGVGIRRVPAITFTEKAAAELRAKIREALQAELARSPGATAARQALAEIDAATISTIHSFCQSLLKRRPLQAALDPLATILDQHAEDELLADVYDCWFDELVLDPPPAMRKVWRAQPIRARRDGSDVLWRICAAVCRDADLLMDRPARRTADLAVDWARVRERARALRDFISANCTDLSDKAASNGLAWLDALDAFDPTEERDDDTRPDPPKPDNRGGSAKKWTAGALDQFKADRDELHDAVAGFMRTIHASVVWDVYEIARGFARRFDERKTRLGLLGFQDLLVRANRMLDENADDVRADLASLYDEMLIDEFQDTDPLQVEIASRLAGILGERSGAKPRLFVVGDPKQSIYRFRRADIEIYEEAKRRWLAGGEPHFLTVNFRCAPAIIDAVNAVFSAILPADAATETDPRYVPLVAGRLESGDRRAPKGAGVVVLRPGRTLGKADRPGALSYAAIARWIAKSVRDGLAISDPTTGRIRPMRFGDVAILNRRGTTFDDMEEELRAHGVPFLVVGGKAYYRRPEITGIIAGLRALADPSDSLALGEWLTCDFVGFSDEDLLGHKLAYGSIDCLAAPPADDALSTHLRALGEIAARRNERGCAATVRALFGLADVVTCAAVFRRGDVAVANLQKILDFATASDGAFALFEEFVRRLASDLDSDREEPDHAVVEDGADVVSLLTIHKAKGLDWPVVVLPDLHAQFQEWAGGTVVVRRATDEMGVRLAAGFETEMYQELGKLEQAFQRAERKRLLYVAMTRARDWLVLPLFGRVTYHSKTGAPTKQRGLLGVLAEAGAIDDELRLAGPFAGHVACVEDFDVDEPGYMADPFAHGTYANSVEPTPSQSARIEELLARRSDLAAKSAVAADATTFASPSEHDEQIPRSETAEHAAEEARRLGSAFHALMERLDWANRPSWPDACAQAAREFELDVDGAGRLSRWLDAFAKMPVFEELAMARRFVEVPFTWTGDPDGTGSRDFAGRIDLVAVREGERVVIVDYKTDAVALDRVPERREYYRRQGEIYRAAVGALLSGARPVSVRFCFVEPGVEVAL